MHERTLGDAIYEALERAGWLGSSERVTPLRAQIIDYLDMHGQASTVAIAAHLDRGIRALLPTLLSMQAQGYIIGTRRGKQWEWESL